ncbi:MAG: hypothetical protein KBF88_17530 [Polyangiaceae bacterium]|nr:hypothetical protein [Polyangiaceae bacterium]
MKTTGTWKHLLAISSFGAISLGATGCASETEVDESESAVGSTEVTPFDEQYFDVSVAWPSEQVSALINGDPMDVDYTPDCKFELSFRQEGETKPLLTLKGEPKDEKTASGYEGKALGSGVLTRDQLTRRAMSGSLAFRCSNDQAQRDRGATFEIPPVRFSTRLGTEQVTTVVPKMEGMMQHDIPVTVTLKVNHSRAASGILSNCSAFRDVPKDKIQKSFLSTLTRYEPSTKDGPFGFGKMTTTISVDGGKLKKEFELRSDQQMFVPIAYCREKGAFGSGGVTVDVLGSEGSLSNNKPFPNTTRENEPVKVNTPMKSGEERMIRHTPPKSHAAFDTILRMY